MQSNIPAGSCGSREVVLVVEDEPFIRIATADILRLAGFEVFEAAGGADALEALANGHEVSAVVTDIRMPGMDGLALSREVRSRWPDLPIVFVTGQMPADGMSLDAKVQFLSKPTNPATLIRAIRKAIDARELVGRYFTLLRWPRQAFEGLR